MANAIKRKSKVKKALLISSFLAATLVLIILVFFKRTEAPILQGKVKLGVVYKDKLKLDIYEPTKQLHAKHPVVIYYHGGAWVSGSRITVNNARFNGAFNALRAQGYAIVSPNYTLARFKSSPFPACIEDAFDVISWIEENASTYDFDIKNVGVLGESAGGHLALMTAYAASEKFSSPNKIALNYVVAAYPPTDLHQLYLELGDIRGQISETTADLPMVMQEHFDINQYLFGFDSDKDTTKANQLAELYSPINYLHEDIPNTLIIHGNKDRVVPISQSISLKNKIESMGLGLDFHLLEGVDHAFMHATSQQKEEIQEWIFDFISNQYLENIH